MQNEQHYAQRSGWLRAAVLGANDGILSTASLVIGVAAASTTREPIVLAGVAGIVAGALSMAAGEYVSVSSQSDIERADLEREANELATMPEEELHELKDLYINRGLTEETALEVAKQLTAHNALEAHARDELGMHEITQAKPLQAALSSGAAFTVGGVLPVFVAFLAPVEYMEYVQYVSAILFLIILGAMAAKTGGSNMVTAILRITLWGTLAMLATAIIGHLFGVNVA
ncbi:VIT1/CCC1 transporter family protein [Leeuwenhoekiella marinoflava]|uniref:VIT1/CCC1 family predicted Fe2+/Mn2+ transporter n=2 Tax=Leeuwenhoekiella marinoflava TaxID=988 RepID=A0A4Q0PM85_9FLAO|nr:VIT family protein [Leeuwenhoekiella marinoflava]RXG30821.1 VIT1/CCC1 family predicted Fe2+/Mn2+ transporter [Leeuwenhoekiella marinoflava]SHF15387.1 Predicted Fe2+/Mn2+ transporter, VIT1/CCC1 family [Leeuwenhoekiella marinoflava DSM 3653]